MNADLASGAARWQKVGLLGAGTHYHTSRRLRVVQGRAGGSSPPALSRGLCVFLKRALQTQGKDAPGQSRSQAPGWGAYSYQGGVMGQQAEVANLS